MQTLFETIYPIPPPPANQITITGKYTDLINARQCRYLGERMKGENPPLKAELTPRAA